MKVSTGNEDSNEDSEHEHAQPAAENERRATDQTAGDDDGFESLNGKSSSGEEMAVGRLEADAIDDNVVDAATKHDDKCDAESIDGKVRTTNCDYFIALHLILSSFSSIVIADVHGICPTSSCR